MESTPDTRREWPSLAIMLETTDGGAAWKATTSSLFGRMSDVSMANNRAVALMEFENYFTYPSEVYCLQVGSGKLERCLRRKDFATTDVEVLPNRTILAAGFRPAGLLARAPIPGKLRIMSSSDGKAWNDMGVDYRAVASRVSLAVVDEKHAWAATDTGIILRLRRD
jgi:hypothetical protein